MLLVIPIDQIQASDVIISNDLFISPGGSLNIAGEETVGENSDTELIIPPMNNEPELVETEEDPPFNLFAEETTLTPVSEDELEPSSDNDSDSANVAVKTLSFSQTDSCVCPEKTSSRTSREIKEELRSNASSTSSKKRFEKATGTAKTDSSSTSKRRFLLSLFT